MRPFGRILYPWVTQGFSRASDETRTRIAPSFFARERNKGKTINERSLIMSRIFANGVFVAMVTMLATVTNLIKTF